MVLESPKQFAKSLAQEAAVYALVVAGTYTSGALARIGNVSHKNLGLPEELRGYEDVFSEEGAD